MNRKNIAIIELTSGVTILVIMFLIPNSFSFYLTALGGVLVGLGIKDFFA